MSRVKIDIYAPLKSETTRKTLAQVKGRAVNHIESPVGRLGGGSQRCVSLSCPESLVVLNVVCKLHMFSRQCEAG